MLKAGGRLIRPVRVPRDGGRRVPAPGPGAEAGKIACRGLMTVPAKRDMQRADTPGHCAGRHGLDGELNGEHSLHRLPAAAPRIVPVIATPRHRTRFTRFTRLLEGGRL